PVPVDALELHGQRAGAVAVVALVEPVHQPARHGGLDAPAPPHRRRGSPPPRAAPPPAGAPARSSGPSQSCGSVSPPSVCRGRLRVERAAPKRWLTALARV